MSTGQVVGSPFDPFGTGHIIGIKSVARTAAGGDDQQNERQAVEDPVLFH